MITVLHALASLSLTQALASTSPTDEGALEFGADNNPILLHLHDDGQMLVYGVHTSTFYRIDRNKLTVDPLLQLDVVRRWRFTDHDFRRNRQWLYFVAQNHELRKLSLESYESSVVADLESLTVGGAQLIWLAGFDENEAAIIHVNGHLWSVALDGASEPVQLSKTPTPMSTYCLDVMPPSYGLMTSFGVPDTEPLPAFVAWNYLTATHVILDTDPWRTIEYHAPSDQWIRFDYYRFDPAVTIQICDYEVMPSNVELSPRPWKISGNSFAHTQLSHDGARLALVEDRSRLRVINTLTGTEICAKTMAPPVTSVTIAFDDSGSTVGYAGQMGEERRFRSVVRWFECDKLSSTTTPP